MNYFPDDIRWKQRFDNYMRAYQVFNSAIQLAKTRPLSDLEEQGLIQSFEYTHELAWKVLKDYLISKGFTEIICSKDSTRMAFQNGLIHEGEIWMSMIDARNRTSHTYDMKIAAEVLQDIRQLFYTQLTVFFDTFYALYKSESSC
jgi:nucleotidyltransferase substrate binding protein (TIGR01987 family)